MKTHVFRKKRYKILFVNKSKLGKDTLGTCDSPQDKDKEIKVYKNLSPKESLITELHESLHSCLFDLDEPAIDEISTDIGEFLWKLGYRKQKNKKDKNAKP